MNTYTEILQREKVFKSFLTQLNRKSEWEINYYVLYGRTKPNDYSCIGYLTNNMGFHGIHYNRTTNNYYFGTRNNKIKSEIHMLMPPQIALIPSHLKDAMFDVANNKICKKVKNVKAT